MQRIMISGRVVDLDDIQPEDILIKDIAYALAHTSRKQGQTQAFFSHAEFAVRLASMLKDKGKDVQLAALLRYSIVAYMGDVPDVITDAVPLLKQIEQNIYDAVAIRFRLRESVNHQAIVDAEGKLGLMEIRDLTSIDIKRTHLCTVELPQNRIQPMAPLDALNWFTKYVAYTMDIYLEDEIDNPYNKIVKFAIQ
jgi:hypothetical protein